MTTFQVLALGFLAATVAATYGKEIFAAVQRRLPAARPSAAASTNCVNDMIIVADMRDRLRAIGCTEGVDACTYLLKVLVEFKYPQG